jgi:hypothetical protein
VFHFCVSVKLFISNALRVVVTLIQKF